MGDFDDINSYNGDLEHDMWVDYNYFLNTGEGEYDDEDEEEQEEEEEEEENEDENEYVEEFEAEYQQKVNEAIKRIRKILSEACDSDEEQKRQR